MHNFYTMARTTERETATNSNDKRLSSQVGSSERKAEFIEQASLRDSVDNEKDHYLALKIPRVKKRLDQLPRRHNLRSRRLRAY